MAAPLEQVRVSPHAAGRALPGGDVGKPWDFVVSPSLQGAATSSLTSPVSVLKSTLRLALLLFWDKQEPQGTGESCTMGTDLLPGGWCCSWIAARNIFSHFCCL